MNVPPAYDMDALTGASPTRYSDEELRAFVGEKAADYYLAKWRPLRRGLAQSAGFNWAAAFFNVAWFIHRRMWAWGMGLGFGMSILGVALQADGVNPTIWSLAEMAAFGFLANVVLYRRATRVIDEARASFPLDPLPEIARRGGTGASVSWLWMLALLFLVAAFIALSLPRLDPGQFIQPALR